MNNSFEQYNLLSYLFYYPGPGFQESVKKAQAYLDEYYPAAGTELKIFTDFVLQASQIELEELFTRSFDVQAATTLDLGYVLFGDDYKRGQVLVNLNSEHKEAGNDCGSELADHLPNILRLLYKMNKPELRTELVEKIIAPAVKKIISEFNPQKIEKKNVVYRKHHRTIIESSPDYALIYQYPLRAVYQVMRDDFKFKEKEPQQSSSDFLKSVGSEMNIEAK
jgi:nitrate reductase molybdenum cofactor assembly chaperone